MGYVTKCSWNNFLRWHLDNRRYLCRAWLIIICSKGVCLTLIEATVVEILATSDAGALLGGFDKLNIIVISKSWIRQSQDEWTRHTYPEQTLSLGLPTPSAPPLESYCPPISSLFNLSTVSGRMHPVTESTVNCLQWLYTMRTHAGRISRLWIRVPIGIPTRSRNRLEGALGNRCPCPKRNNKTAYPLGARYRRCLYEGLCLIRLDLSWYILKQDLTEAELNYDIILIVMPRKESEIYAHQ